VDLYEKHNTYLPAINGLAPLTKINGSSLSTDFKVNFLQLEELVMIGGPHDGVITPWQSRYI
jgi:palmitoyl-protein thioesterase